MQIVIFCKLYFRLFLFTDIASQIKLASCDIDKTHACILLHIRAAKGLPLYLLVSSADHFCKQFGPRSSPTKRRA